MPPYLPDEILLELVEVHLSDASDAQLRDTLCNFSLTSRRFRSFAIRVLYYSLSFRTDFRRTVTPQDKMVSMIRNYTRAKHLIHSRHLLRNVRRLSLHHWDGSFLEHLGLENWEDFFHAGIQRLGVKPMMEMIYDNLTRLVPHMPRLRELRLVGCVMTTFLYAAISACPLNLLHVDTNWPADPIHFPKDLPQKTHVTELHYRYAHQIFADTFDVNISDPFVARTLEHCISSLEELFVDSELLPMFASYISDKTLSLKNLYVSFPAFPTGSGTTWQSSAACSLWEILLASPQLRELIIMGISPEIPPPGDFKNHVLPNLVNIYASPHILRLLPTQGRNPRRVHISMVLDVNRQPITQLIRCSPTHLRQFSVTCAKTQTVRELLDFIQSLSPFNNLESLEIVYSLNPTLWREYNDMQEASNTVTNLLQGLTHLHTCQIRNIMDPNFHRDSPLLVDPQSLGHLSLKEFGVDFCTKNVWSRDVEMGWLQQGWEPKSGQTWYDGIQSIL